MEASWFLLTKYWLGIKLIYLRTVCYSFVIYTLKTTIMFSLNFVNSRMFSSKWKVVRQAFQTGDHVITDVCANRCLGPPHLPARGPPASDKFSDDGVPGRQPLRSDDSEPRTPPPEQLSKKPSFNPENPLSWTDTIWDKTRFSSNSEEPSPVLSEASTQGEAWAGRDPCCVSPTCSRNWDILSTPGWGGCCSF